MVIVIVIVIAYHGGAFERKTDNICVITTPTRVGVCFVITYGVIIGLTN